MAIIEIIKDDVSLPHGYEIGSRIEATLEIEYDPETEEEHTIAIVMRDGQELVIYEDEFVVIELD